MANEMSTAGISLGWALEATPGSRPSSYASIPNVKTIGDMNQAPATYDATDLSDLIWKKYIPALRDPGGAIPITVNMNQTFATAWASIVSSAESGKSQSKACWFCVTIPNWTQKWYFAGEPMPLGLPQVDTDSIFDGDAYITPSKIEGFA
jgi:hypothetical protein